MTVQYLYSSVSNRPKDETEKYAMYFELECISCYASVNWGQTDWDIRHCPHKMRALGHLSLIE